MVEQQTHTCLPECLHAMNETQLTMPHVPSRCLLHYPMQVPIGNKSIVNPDSYHTTRSLCDKCKNLVCLFWATELFGLHRRSLTPFDIFMGFNKWILYLTNVPGFSHDGVTVPSCSAQHTLFIFLFILETVRHILDVFQSTSSLTHSSTMIMDDHTHAHPPNIMRCPCAYAMLMPQHVLMLHV